MSQRAAGLSRRDDVQRGGPHGQRALTLPWRRPMDPHREQAITCIRRSGLQHIADNLIGLLRPSIHVHIEAVPEQNFDIGVSKIGGSPDLPEEMAWPTRNGTPLPFYAQIRCADLVSYDLPGILPHTGWLYFFYDVLSDNPRSSRQERSENWQVFYVSAEPGTLRRVPAPATLDEWEQYGSCAVTFSPGIMLPDFGSHLLEECHLSFSTYTGESVEHERYRQLLQQLRDLSGSDSNTGIHLLGYPDEFGAEQDSEWVLLLQIDANRAAQQGATKMAKGDWLAIYFWIPRDALAQRDFNRVEVLTNGD